MTFESLEELAVAQAMAAERYPEIAHLSEFITAADAAGVMELAADMSRGLAASKQPGPRTTANSGEQTPPAEASAEEKQPGSAEIIAGFREGRTHKRDPEAASAFFSARLNEASGR